MKNLDEMYPGVDYNNYGGYGLTDRIFEEMRNSPNHEPSLESALEMIDWFGFEVQYSGGCCGKIWLVGRECVNVIHKAIYNKDKRIAQLLIDRANENELESVI